MADGYSDQEKELLISCEARGYFARADNLITSYQLDKLKFLISSILSRRQVEDSETITNIYEELKVKFEQDSKLVVEVLNVMLKIVGMNSECVDSKPSVIQTPSFQWRLKLICCSDVVVNSKKMSQLIDHMYKKYDLSLDRENVASPIALFQHMIDRALITPGKEDIILEVEAIMKIWKQRRYAKIILCVIVIISLLVTIGLFLSLIKYASIEDIVNSNKPIYFNGDDVTVLVGKVFDLRKYDKIDISLISKAVEFEIYFGYASICQVQCSSGSEMSNVMSKLSLNYHESIKITKHSPQKQSYLKIIDTTDETPSVYLLKGSQIHFNIKPPLFALKSNVTLNVFSNVFDCESFYLYSDSIPYKGQQIVNLTVANNFTFSFTMASDDYICIVAQFPGYHTYTSTITGSMYQYHNISYLSSQNLCALNISLKRDIDGINLGIVQPLNRSLMKSIFSLSQHKTCVLVTVTSACPYSTCSFGLKWKILGTMINPGMMITSGVASIIFIMALIILCLLCVLCIKC